MAEQLRRIAHIKSSFYHRLRCSVSEIVHAFSLFVLCRWDAGSVVHLAAMFKDVPMTQDELQFVIEKLLRLLGELDLQEFPPLVYQLLILASKVSQL